MNDFSLKQEGTVMDLVPLSSESGMFLWKSFPLSWPIQRSLGCGISVDLRDIFGIYQTRNGAKQQKTSYRIYI
jgi:hypothetical protein